MKTHWIPRAWSFLHSMTFTVLHHEHCLFKSVPKNIEALLGTMTYSLDRRLRTRRWCFQGLFLLTAEPLEERRIWILPRKMALMAMICVYGSFWRPLGLAWRTFHKDSRRADAGAIKMNLIPIETVIVTLDLEHSIDNQMNQRLKYSLTCISLMDGKGLRIKCGHVIRYNQK